MSDYLLALLALAVAWYSYTYARWLKANGYNCGAITMYLLILLDLLGPAYRLFKKWQGS